jgi:predicted RNase H-like HicB family nuclease
MLGKIEGARVIYHREADGWWAESPDVERWCAAGDSYAAVRQLAVDGIPFARDCESSRLESEPGPPRQ